MTPQRNSAADRAQRGATHRALWRESSTYVDAQMRAMVSRWQVEEFRLRQLQALREGRRELPLHEQPPGAPCPLVGPTACLRMGPHLYHVGLTGRVEDDSLRVHGWT